MTTTGFTIDGTVIVTGASRGIGEEVCAELARRGARVVAVARGEEGLARTLGRLKGEGHTAIAADVAEPASWPAVIGAAGDGPLAGLVTAAAVLDPIGTLDQIDPAEFATTLRINVTGTMLAIRAALPGLRASSGSIVTFSGGGATKPFPRYDAYAASKAAVVRLTENVAAAEPGLRANSIAPGFVKTAMHEATFEAGAERVGEDYLAETRRQLDEGGVPPEQAARLAAVLIGPPGEGITGKLISAQWDPYEDQAFLSRLRAEPEFCTLRRIDDVFFTATERQ